MKKYIVEIDCTSNSYIVNVDGYSYSSKLFDTQKDAEAYANRVLTIQGKRSVYLISVYEAEFNKESGLHFQANRVAVFRDIDGLNTILDENPAVLNLYTRKVWKTDAILIGTETKFTREWNIATNQLEQLTV